MPEYGMMIPVMHMEEYLNTVLRPLLRGDGGEIEYNGFENGVLRVTLRGECSFCPKTQSCLSWCEEKILKDTGKAVKIEAQCRRPYFRDR